MGACSGEQMVQTEMLIGPRGKERREERRMEGRKEERKGGMSLKNQIRNQNGPEESKLSTG